MLNATVKSLLYWAQVPRLLRALRRDAVVILMYHGVTPAGTRPLRGDRVAADQLERQLRFVRAHFDVRPLSVWLDGAHPAGGRPGLAITFDDGLRSVGTLAAPLLRRYECPATVFLCPGLIERGESPWFERLYQLCVAKHGETPAALAAYDTYAADLKRLALREQSERLEALRLQWRLPTLPVHEDGALMTWNEIRACGEGGWVEFGAHTMNHVILSRLDRVEQAEEIALSCRAVAERTGACASFAYPNGKCGDFTPETVELVRRSGVRGAVTALPGLATPELDRFQWPRLSVAANTADAQFALRTAGVIGERA